MSQARPVAGLKRRCSASVRDASKPMTSSRFALPIDQTIAAVLVRDERVAARGDDRRTIGGTRRCGAAQHETDHDHADQRPRTRAFDDVTRRFHSTGWMRRKNLLTLARRGDDIVRRHGHILPRVARATYRCCTLLHRRRPRRRRRAARTSGAAAPSAQRMGSGADRRIRRHRPGRSGLRARQRPRSADARRAAAAGSGEQRQSRHRDVRAGVSRPLPWIAPLSFGIGLRGDSRATFYLGSGAALRLARVVHRGRRHRAGRRRCRPASSKGGR